MDMFSLGILLFQIVDPARCSQWDSEIGNVQAKWTKAIKPWKQYHKNQLSLGNANEAAIADEEIKKGMACFESEYIEVLDRLQADLKSSLDTRMPLICDLLNRDPSMRPTCRAAWQIWVLFISSATSSADSSLGDAKGGPASAPAEGSPMVVNKAQIWHGISNP